MTVAAFRGFTLVLCDWNTEKIMRVLQEEKINYTMFAPAMTSMLVNHPDIRKYDFSHIERIITSAAPISPGLLRKASEIFGEVYSFTYGTSETALGGSQCQIEDVSLEGPTSKRIASVGKAMMGMNVRVVDDNGNDIPWGSDQIGEIVVSGPTVGKGYWKKPESSELQDGTWYSGDLARVDEDGFIYIVDRKKDMILSGGINIYPREIEDVLYTHPAVQQAAVIGVPHDVWGESVKAIIVLKPGAKVTEEEIIEYCKAHLADYKKPRIVEFRDKLPINPSGKILKRELREEHWKGYERKV
jgi:long-chain acyl-CoA synthetase